MTQGTPQIEGFGIDVGARDGARVEVTVTGEVDLYSAPLMKDQVLTLIADGVRDLWLELSGVTFIDSTGLGVIVSALKRLREGGGELHLVRPSPPTLKVLEITGLHKLIPIEG